MENSKMVNIGLAFLVISALTLMMSPANTAQQIGWQFDSFEDNIKMTITPEEPTTDKPIIITIDSIFPDVHINVANLYAIIEPDGGLEFEYHNVFQRLNNTAMRCAVGPFAYSGFYISFYVVAYDWLNYQMDSRESFNYIHYYVAGSGWKHDNFDDNVLLTYAPLTVNATEEVTVTIASKDDVSFRGANLWWTYETPEGVKVVGVGKNFTNSNMNMTEMSDVILGYPAGTNVTFWVQVWDQYMDQMISREYNYSVLGVIQYTDFPFEYSDDGSGNLDKSKWYPDMQILLPMLGLCALGIPLFLYQYVLSKKKEERVEGLVTSNEELESSLAPKDEEGEPPGEH